MPVLQVRDLPEEIYAELSYLAHEAHHNCERDEYSGKRE
jgi:hypothetical protein